MAFSLSGTTITQSGTDTDLSGLADISDVTTVEVGSGVDARIIYLIGDRKLLVSGSLLHDARVEEILFGANAPTPTVDVSDTGVYSAGLIQSYDGEDTYTGGIPWSFTKAGGTAWVENDSSIRVQNGGTLNIYGCTIKVSGNRSLWYAVGAKGTIRDVSIHASTGAAPRTYMLSTLTDIDGFYVYGFGSCNFDAAMVQLNNFIPHGVLFPFFYNGSAADGKILEVSNFKRLGNTSGDIQGQGACKFILRNKVEGADTLEVFGRGRNNDNDFVVELIKEVKINSLDDIGSALPDVKFYSKDINSGIREDFTAGTAETNTNYVDDRVYQYITDALGKGVSQDVLAAVCVANNHPTTNNYNATPVTPIAVDDRASSGIMAFSGIHYNKSIAVVSVTLEGAGESETDWTFFIDGSITEADKATVDAYTELGTPQKLYDRAKAYLYDSYVGEIETIVSLSGNTIDARDYDVVIDKEATNVFDLIGNTITIKATTFTGNITTTGTITKIGGADVVGIENSSVGTTGLLELS